MIRFYDFEHERYRDIDTGKANLDKLSPLKALSWNELIVSEYEDSHPDPRHTLHIYDAPKIKKFIPKDNDFDKECAAQEKAKEAKNVPILSSDILGRPAYIENSVIYNCNPCGLKDNVKEHLAALKIEAEKRGNGIKPVVKPPTEMEMYSKGYSEALNAASRGLDHVLIDVPYYLKKVALQIIVLVDDMLEELKKTYPQF